MMKMLLVKPSKIALMKIYKNKTCRIMHNEEYIKTFDWHQNVWCDVIVTSFFQDDVDDAIKI